MPPSPPSLVPGTLIGRKYRIDRIIGQGGMGVVALATHVNIRSQVAVKIILPEYAASPIALQRLMEEAQNAGRILSDHVVRIVDADVTDEGLAFIAMEYLNGHDFAEEIKMRGRVSPIVAAEIVSQVCSALRSAHDLGIVHRDLKPSNVFLTRRPDGTPLVKVLDFGISKDTTALQRGDLTATALTLGSPLYMSPEQMMNPKSVDGRSDVWSVGIVLFEALTGTTPFDAETMAGLSVAIATQPPRDLGALAPSTPPAMQAIVRRCLEKSRDLRFPSAAALQEELRAFLNGTATLRVSEPPLVQTDVTAPQFAGTTPGTGRTISDARPEPRGTALWIGVGIGGAVALGLGATLMLTLGSKTAGSKNVRTQAEVTSESTTSASAAPPPIVAPATPPPVVASAAPSATPPAPPPLAVGALPASDSHTTDKRPKPVASAKPDPAPPPAAAPPSTPPAKADCSPPYTLDANGHKRFKPQCL